MSHNLILLILSQVGMSLYPSVIKLVSTNLETQTAIRFLSYGFLALLGIFFSSNKFILSYSALEYIGFGLINLVHVIASYSCFRILSSGISYTLFYTYPIFNLLGRMLFYNEPIQLMNFIYISIAILGVYILTYEKNTTPSTTLSNITENNMIQELIIRNPLLIGTFTGILSAITETTMYLLVKNTPLISPFQQITRFYLMGFILSIIFIGYKLLTKDKITLENGNTNNKFFSIETLDFQFSWIPILEMLLFNMIVGFIGYIVLLYIIPRTSTIQFNTYIFLGIIFSYIWGFLLNGETILPRNVIGSLLILFAIIMVNLK